MHEHIYVPVAIASATATSFGAAGVVRDTPLLVGTHREPAALMGALAS
jgi:hypothetical protein